MTISIADIADETFLQFVWHKLVRTNLRSMTLSNFNLCPDPLHYVAYDWGLDSFVNGLAQELRAGQFAPGRGELLRAAKANGLSRPLCFLTPRDALVYKAITWIARDSLVASADSWVASDDDVNVGEATDGGQQRDPDPPTGNSFDWFNFWLARHSGLVKMLNNEAASFIVESDIANFYPSIRLDAVREHLLALTNLDKQVVRLCIQIIDGVMPRTDYAETSLMGLPQEQLDSSRPIAHSLLIHVDEEFRREGINGQYTRFMDDILLTVKTVEEGELVIARLQRRLESLGLYPNPAKTRIISKKQCFDERMIERDLLIEKLSSSIDDNSTPEVPHRRTADDEQLEELRQITRVHRLEDRRPKRWDRLTRRLYTLHRELSIDDWWNYWELDLHSDPSSAANILEYVRSWPINSTTTKKLVGLSRRYSELYTDVSLLAAETVLTAPVVKNERLWANLAMYCEEEFLRLSEAAAVDPRQDRAAASWLLASWKYAEGAKRTDLLSAVPKTDVVFSATRAQALPLVAAAGATPIDEWLGVKPGLDWESAFAVEYLRSLQRRDEDALKAAYDLVEPQIRLTPQRFTLLPRALPLLEVAGEAVPGRTSKAARKLLRALQQNPSRLRDKRTEFLVSRWL